MTTELHFDARSAQQEVGREVTVVGTSYMTSKGVRGRVVRAEPLETANEQWAVAIQWNTRGVPNRINWFRKRDYEQYFGEL